MTFPLLIGGLVLSPSFKEQESCVLQEIGGLNCSDFGVMGMAASGDTANFVSTGRVSLSAHPDTTDSSHLLLPPQAYPYMMEKQAKTGRADEIPKVGWKKSPALHLRLRKTFPITRLLSSFTISGSKWSTNPSLIISLLLVLNLQSCIFHSHQFGETMERHFLNPDVTGVLGDRNATFCYTHLSRSLVL